MQVSALNIAGGVVSWKVGPTDRSALLDSLRPLDLEWACPDERSGRPVLREAMESIFAEERNVLIRPMQNSDALSAVLECRGSQANTYSTVMVATIDDNGVISVEDNEDARQVLQDRYDRFRQQLTGALVTAALVKIVVKLNGVALRPGGGVYWLPKHQLDAWKRVASAFEFAAIKSGDTAVYLMRTVADIDLIKQVKAAIIDDITATVKVIGEEVAGGQLGERALETREGQLDDAMARLREYEAIIGESLDAVRNDIQSAMKATAHSVFLRAAARRRPVNNNGSLHAITV